MVDAVVAPVPRTPGNSSTGISSIAVIPRSTSSGRWLIAASNVPSGVNVPTCSSYTTRSRELDHRPVRRPDERIGVHDRETDRGSRRAASATTGRATAAPSSNDPVVVAVAAGQLGLPHAEADVLGRVVTSAEADRHGRCQRCPVAEHDRSRPGGRRTEPVLPRELVRGVAPGGRGRHAAAVGSSGSNHTTASGGRSTSAEVGWPCQAMPAASTTGWPAKASVPP